MKTAFESGIDQGTADHLPADVTPLPAFTVIIPLYKGGEYLAETLESVLAQTYSAAEIIVVDDGSPDDSYRVAEAYGDRVRLIRRENAGVSATRNFAASLAATEWIHFLDQDDVWEPHHLQDQANAIAADPSLDAVYTGRRVLRQDREAGTFHLSERVEIPSAADFPVVLQDRPPLPPSSVCLRRSAFLRTGGFDSRYNGLEDWDLFLRMNQQGSKFVNVDAPSVQYRIHAAANTNNPLPLLKVGTEIVQHDILPHLPKWKRRAHGRRVNSRLEAEAAILLREMGRPGGLRVLTRSIMRHPFHKLRRYRIAAHMLLRGENPGASGGK